MRAAVCICRRPQALVPGVCAAPPPRQGAPGHGRIVCARVRASLSIAPSYSCTFAAGIRRRARHWTALSATAQATMVTRTPEPADALLVSCALNPPSLTPIPPAAVALSVSQREAELGPKYAPLVPPPPAPNAGADALPSVPLPQSSPSFSTYSFKQTQQPAPQPATSVHMIFFPQKSARTVSVRWRSGGSRRW